MGKRRGINKLPTRVYVRWDGEGDERYLLAHESLEACVEIDAHDIGVFELSEVKRGRLAPKWER